MDELLVTTRLPVVAAPGIVAYGLVPIDGDGPCWRAVAIVARWSDEAGVVAIAAVDGGTRDRLLAGLTDQLRAAGCARLHVDGTVVPL